MNCRRTARATGWLVGLALGAPAPTAPVALAQLATPPAPATGAAPAAAARPAARGVDLAMRQAQATGRDLIVVLTSEALPSSRALGRALPASEAGRSLAGTAIFHELVAEQEPERARQLDATAVPSVYVFRPAGSSFTALGRLPAPRTADEAGRWLAVVLGGDEGPGAGAEDSPALPTVRDAAVARAGHGHDHAAQATPQAFSPPPAAPPGLGAPPSPPPVMQPPAAPPAMAPPTVGLGMPQPSIVVPTPSPSIYVQPQNPTIVVGTPTAANVVYASPVGTPMAAAPTLGAPMMAAAPTLGAAPAPAPTMALAAAPTLGAAPAAPAQPYVVGLVLDRPGPGRRMLAALGRELASLGNPRIRMATTPEFAQVSLPTTNVPTAAPPVVVAPPAAPQPPAVGQPPEPPLPSPQGPAKKKGLFHHD